jgi:hypothetical protein
MKHRSLNCLLFIALVAMLVGHVQATDPNTFSPVVSFVYLESLDEPEANGAVMSPLVSFQFYEWPGDENLTFQNSLPVSFFFSGGVSLAFSGTVKTSAGIPIAGAFIKLKRYGTVFWSGTSGVNGVFTASNVQAAKFMINVTKTGFTDLLNNFDGELGGSESVDLVMAPITPVPPTQATDRVVSASAVGNCTPWDQNSLTASRLLVLNPNGQWETSLSLLNSNLTTVVLTHGWNGNPTLADDWTSCQDSTKLARVIQQLIGGANMANIVAWDWHTDAGTSGLLKYKPPTDKAACQGMTLGNALLQSLGSDYSQHIHFIGHSLGALVNRFACDYVHRALQGPLTSDNPPTGWSSSLTKPHVTLLDEAEVASFAQANVMVSTATAGALALAASGGDLVSAALAGGVQASVQVKQDWKYPIPANAHWVDNYVSALGFGRPEAVNVGLPGGTYSSINPLDAHSYAHVWYVRSAIVTGFGLAPPVGWRLSMEYARTFPPIGIGLTQGSAWLENLGTTDQLDLTLVTNTLAANFVPSIVSNYVVGVGKTTIVKPLDSVGRSVLDHYVAGIEFVGQKVGTAIYTTGQVVTAANQKVGLFIDAATDAATDLTNSIEPTSQQASAVTHGGYSVLLSSTEAPRPASMALNSAQKQAQPAATMPAGAWMTVDVPKNVGLLIFDFTVSGSPAEDQIVCAINDQNIFTLPAKFAQTATATSTDMLDVSSYAGQTVELFFGLVGGTSSNCTVSIDGIRFITIPDPTVGIADLGSTFGVKWPAAATGWVLESSDTLAPDSWQVVPADSSLTFVDGVATLVVSKIGSRRFYRLRLLP